VHASTAHPVCLSVLFCTHSFNKLSCFKQAFFLASIMASAAAASSSSSSSASAAAPAAAASPHPALAFFDTHPRSFANLSAAARRPGGDASFLMTGRAQVAQMLGLEDAAAVADLEVNAEALTAAAAAATAGKKGSLLTPDAEQAEVAVFLQWASGPAAPHVRQIVSELPRAVYADSKLQGGSGALLGSVVSRAELIDLSPKGRVDDEVFSKHRDVWERITRGCAVLRLTLAPAAAAGAGAGVAASAAAAGSSPAVPILRWAIRVNN